MAGVHVVVRDVHRTSLVVALLGVVVLVLQCSWPPGSPAPQQAATGRAPWPSWPWAPTTPSSSGPCAAWRSTGRPLVLAAIAVVHDAPDWSERRRALVLVGLVAAAVVHTG